ncbi:hypothetical protein P0D70_32240 [Paraburkholderia sp. RL17-381-BIF-C]
MWNSIFRSVMKFCANRISGFFERLLERTEVRPMFGVQKFWDVFHDDNVWKQFDRDFCENLDQIISLVDPWILFAMRAKTLARCASNEDERQ